MEQTSENMLGLDTGHSTSAEISGRLREVQSGALIEIAMETHQIVKEVPQLRRGRRLPD